MIKALNRGVERLLVRGAVSPSSGLHLNCMDGLRGLAILMVVCCHGFYYNPSGPPLYKTVSRLIGSGWMGVPIFFVLSGFLISYPFFKARSADPGFWYPRGYATRRILKIFPPFYLTIVAVVVFNFVWLDDPAYFVAGLQWATGAAHYVNPGRDINGAFWSLWVELHFYLVLPFLFLLFRRAGGRGTYWGLFLILALVPPLVRTLTWPGAAPKGEFELVMRRFPNALDNFAWGVLLAGWYVTGVRSQALNRRLARLGFVGLVLLVISAGVLQFVPFPPRARIELERFLPGIAAFLLCFFIFDPAGAGARFFSAPILRFIGLVSFEWFLFHQPFQTRFHDLIGSTQGKLPLYLAAVIGSSLAALGLAAVVYYCFSLPILRWGRDRLARQRKPSPAPSPASPVSVEVNPR